MPNHKQPHTFSSFSACSSSGRSSSSCPRLGGRCCCCKSRHECWETGARQGQKAVLDSNRASACSCCRAAKTTVGCLGCDPGSITLAEPAALNNALPASQL